MPICFGYVAEESWKRRWLKQPKYLRIPRKEEEFVVFAANFVLNRVSSKEGEFVVVALFFVFVFGTKAKEAHYRSCEGRNNRNACPLL